MKKKATRLLEAMVHVHGFVEAQVWVVARSRVVVVQGCEGDPRYERVVPCVPGTELATWARILREFRNGYLRAPGKVKVLRYLP